MTSPSDAFVKLVFDLLHMAAPQEATADEVTGCVSALGSAFILACKATGASRDSMKESIDILWETVEAIEVEMAAVTQEAH